MARIRSVHPSLWTDEAFVELTVCARLFLIGLWNEADDYGLFEWKPLRLKMRLAPADTIDAPTIMDELSAAGFLVRLRRAGMDLGVVKNFRKFQRPKTPSAPIVPLDSGIASVIGLRKDDVVPKAHGSVSEAPPQDIPRAGEIPSQMEDGGDSKGDSETPDGVSGAGAPLPSIGDMVWSVGLSFLKTHVPDERKARAILGKWRKGHGDVATLGALVAAQKESVSEAVSWIEARLGNGGRNGQSGRNGHGDAVADRYDAIRAGGLKSLGYRCGDDGLWRDSAGQVVHDPGGSGVPS